MPTARQSRANSGRSWGASAPHASGRADDGHHVQRRYAPHMLKQSSKFLAARHDCGLCRRRGGERPGTGQGRLPARLAAGRRQGADLCLHRKGFCEDAGIEVSIEPGRGSSEAITKLATGVLRHRLRRYRRADGGEGHRGRPRHRRHVDLQQGPACLLRRSRATASRRSPMSRARRSRRRLSPPRTCSCRWFSRMSALPKTTSR